MILPILDQCKRGSFLMLMFALSLFLFPTTSYSQQSPAITGKVTAKNGDAVTAAQIILKGTAYRSTAGSDGTFRLAAPAGQYTLEISRVGFHTYSSKITLSAGKDLAVAQIVLAESTDMQEVSITEKSKTQKVNDLGFNVTAIDAKTLHHQGGDINQILNTVSGVRIRETGGLGSTFNFSLNGFSGKQVKFFLDGIPMDNFGPSLTLNNFPANMAERIEIYKGVLPVSLGTDALGGAVNIITRTHANFLDASYSYGSFNTHRASINAAYTNAKSGFTIRANGFYNFSNNNYKVNVPIRDQNGNEISRATVKRFHDDYESSTMQIEAGVAGKKYADRLLFGLLASGNDKDQQTGVSSMDRPFGAITSNSQSYIPTLKYAKKDLFLPGFDVSLYSAYNMTNFEQIDTTARVYNWLGEYYQSSTSGELSRTRNKIKNREFLTTINLNYHLTERQVISLNYVYSHFKRTGFDPEDPTKIANQFPTNATKNVLGAAWNYEIRNKLTTSVFAKLYNYDANSFETTGNFTNGGAVNSALNKNATNFGAGFASAYYLREDLMAKLSFEHAYRLPEPDELFGDGLFILKNPSLKPEKSENINVGLRYTLPTGQDHRLSIEPGFIYRATSDFIRVPASASSPTSSFINTGNVRTVGVDGEVKYDYKGLIHASANVTWQKITDQTDSIATSGFTGGKTANILKGFRMPNIPYLFGNFNVGTQFSGIQKDAVLSFNYSLNYVKNYYLSATEIGTLAAKTDMIPTQLAHNAFVNYAMAKGKYNVNLECRNIFDNELFDSYRMQKPGRAFYVKLRYFISK